MTQVRLAVIGAGVIGSRHVDLIMANAHCQLVAICDTNPGRQILADKLDVPFYADYEKMLGDIMPDGVIISTPTEQHGAAGLACARASVHILVEKPITASVEEGQRLVSVADEKGIQVLVGHHRRHNPRIQQARTIVQGKEIGKLVSVALMWTLQKPDDYYSVQWRTQPGGGPVLINLIHEMDTLRFVCGEIASVYTATASAARGFDVEDSASLTLRFANGALGTVTATDAVPAPWSYELTTFENLAYAHVDENCYFFLGTKGSLAFPRMELWHYPHEAVAGWYHPLEKRVIEVADRDPLIAQLEHFCRVICGEESPVVSGADGLKTLEATLAVHESARQNAPIELSDRL